MIIGAMVVIKATRQFARVVAVRPNTLDILPFGTSQRVTIDRNAVRWPRVSDRDKGATDATKTLGALLVLGLIVFGILFYQAPKQQPAPTVSATATVLPHLVKQPTGAVAEDDPGWNCLTQGDGLCGPMWSPVPRDAYADLDETVEDRDWSNCLIWTHAGVTTVACTDGAVYAS